MRILMRGRVRNVTDKVGRTLILIGKAVEAPEPKPEPKPKRTYKRRDMVPERAAVVVPETKADEDSDTIADETDE